VEEKRKGLDLAISSSATSQRKAFNDKNKSTKANYSKWKKQSNQFKEAIKAGKEYEKAKREGRELPPPTNMSSTPDPDLVPCPHCKRTFNPDRAPIHIEKCKNIQNRPSNKRNQPPSGRGRGRGSKKSSSSSRSRR